MTENLLLTPVETHDANDHVLISAIACNPAYGSEGWIAYRYIEGLAKCFNVTVIAGKPATVPEGVVLHELDIGQFDPNDVGNEAHRKFERRQRELLIHRPEILERATVVHRLTPCSLEMPTWLAECGKPLVIGPAIGAEGAPSSFDRYRHWELSRGGLVARGLNWLHRQRLRWQTTRMDHVRRSVLLIAGNALAERAIRRVGGVEVGTGDDGPPARSQSTGRQCTFVRLPHCGIESNEFSPDPNRWDSDVDSGPLRLLFVGRAVPYKGVELLLESLSLLGSDVDVRLTIAGDFSTPYGEICRMRAASLKISEKINWRPRVPRNDMVDLYRQHDIFCFPTLSDTYGIAMLEAMSCGCAVIASDICGPAELVASDRGIKIPMVNPEQYVRDTALAIRSLAHDRRQLDALGQGARRYIISTHNWTTILDKVLDVYPKCRNQEPASVPGPCH